MLSLRSSVLLGLLPIFPVYALDQLLKAQSGSLGLPWHQHYVERPLWVLFAALLAGLMLVVQCRSALMSLGFSLICGGALSNANDIVKQGFAWNMFPVPGANLYFNLADLFIITGLVMCLVGMVRIIVDYQQAQQA